jgi:hypothetical protein
MAAFPVPVMRTVEEITASREEMRRQSIPFVDETDTQLAMFNGSYTDMRSSADAALHKGRGVLQLPEVFIVACQPDYKV